MSKVYINLIDQKEPIFQFNKDQKKNMTTNSETANYSKKIIDITDKEKKLHDRFLKSELKKNFY